MTTFHDLVRGPFTLDRACLLIAAQVHPPAFQDAVVDAGLAALDALAARCPGPDVGSLREYLFGASGFRGNRAEYEDPRNSYLDEVLARRTGIPITLAVVVIEVGRRLGLTLEPVGMPGHFLVGLGGGQFLDAFDGGQVIDAGGCRARFSALAGPDAPWTDAFLEPVPGAAVISRVLANLRQRFIATSDLGGLDWVLDLRSALPDGDEAAEERASVLSALGRFDEAARVLDRLAVSSPDQEALRSRALRLRARLN